jgi:peroxiredoxin
MFGMSASFALSFLAAGSALAAADKPAADAVVGRQIPGFVLPDADGRDFGLADLQKSRYVVVAFLSTTCPVAKAYIPTLAEIDRSYRDRGVRVLGAYANAGDTPEAVRKHTAEFGIDFPVVVDARQTLLPLFEPRRTAEVYVLDGRRTVRYRGRIDDRLAPGLQKEKASRHDLREAVDELLAGKAVSVAGTEPAGCLITRLESRREKGSITYSGRVADILRKHCVECHHPGTAAPFSLLTYEDASFHAEMIRETVRQRRMPPWHADPRFGKFANERRLTQEEIDVLSAWVADGAPSGDVKTLPPTPQYTEGWRIGTPDVVLKMPREFTVPASGKVPYQYFTTKTGFKQDMWIQAAEVRPGNRAVVHHIIVFYKDPKNALKPPVWISSVAPGTDPVILPPGLGRKIPAGAELVWQMHYTANGKSEKDLSEIGLVFCKEPPRYDVTTYGVSNPFFKIPPGDANYQVVGRVPVIKDAVVLSFFPHMHVRGKSFEYQAIYPDGRKEVLLSVPQYDFNWQHTYRLQEPLRLPKGSEIRCIAHYDNSADNPANPDPKKTVKWGDQTWDEMMLGYLDYYFVGP